MRWNEQPLRPAIFTAWAVGTGRHTPTTGMAQLAQARTLSETISERANAVFRARNLRVPYGARTGRRRVWCHQSRVGR